MLSNNVTGGEDGSGSRVNGKKVGEKQQTTEAQIAERNAYCLKWSSGGRCWHFLYTGVEVVDVISRVRGISVPGSWRKQLRLQLHC